MRKVIVFLAVLIFYLPSLPVKAMSIPVSANGPVTPASLMKKISTYKERDLRKTLGRKLTLKEKVAFYLLKKKAKKMHREEGKPGENAYVAGLIAIGLLVTGLLFPPLLIGSLIAGIVAVASGSKSLKLDPGNKKAKTGKLLGWITIAAIIGLVIALMILVAVFVGTFGSIFG